MKHSILWNRSGEISNPDVEIAGGNDESYIPGNPGLFIMWVKLGSEADRLLSPGCQLIKVSCSSSFFFKIWEWREKLQAEKSSKWEMSVLFYDFSSLNSFPILIYSTSTIFYNINVRIVFFKLLINTRSLLGALFTGFHINGPENSYKTRTYLLEPHSSLNFFVFKSNAWYLMCYHHRLTTQM